MVLEEMLHLVATIQGHQAMTTPMEMVPAADITTTHATRAAETVAEDALNTATMAKEEDATAAHIPMEMGTQMESTLTKIIAGVLNIQLIEAAKADAGIKDVPLNAAQTTNAA